jgi:hypothetical protein
LRGSRHDVADSIDGQGRLGFTATGIKAFVAIDGFVFLELSPMKINGEIRTPLDVTCGIDVNRSYS